MTEPRIETENLVLITHTLEDVRARIEGMDADQKAQLSREWLELLRATASPDPWILGFALAHRLTEVAVGNCGFKGPPGADGVVEIAYGIASDHQGKGYATEAAEALVAFAFGSGRVRAVRAHTLPESNASARVLTKCHFRRIGEVIDPEDGLVWRWERYLD